MDQLNEMATNDAAKRDEVNPQYSGTQMPYGFQVVDTEEVCAPQEVA